METKLGRPVLVETKKETTLWINWKGVLALHGSSCLLPGGVELIIVSLDPNEKIEVGDKWVYICPINGIAYDNHEAINTSNLPNSWYEQLHDRKNYFKVLATQSQLSPEYIQQFMKEYNKGGVMDVNILGEKIALCGTFLPRFPYTTANTDRVTSAFCPKRNKGFLTIVTASDRILDTIDDTSDDGSDPKEVTYTEKDMVAFSKYMSGYSETAGNKFYRGMLTEWSRNNKKK